MKPETRNIRHRPAVGGKRSPNEIARQVIAENPLLTDPFGNTYRYNGQHWEPMEDRVLEKLCREYDAWEHTTRQRVQDTAYYVKSYTLKEEGIPWNNLNPTEIPFQNGVYDLRTGTSLEIVTEDGDTAPIETDLGLRAHRPEDYLETVWPVVWNPFTECLTWDQYLQDCFGHLSEFDAYVSALEEFLGYLLMTKAPYKKALLCYGESNTGKTVLENVMIALVGERNICHIAIDKMGDSRAIAPIKGKALNVVGELKFDAILSDSGFKRLVSTGEPVEIDRKYKDPEIYRPFCKHAIFTNSLPVVHDHSHGVFNRLLLIEFPNVIPPERQDPELSHKLEAEIDGIALRALQGLSRLIANNGQFTIPNTLAAHLKDYQEESNPVHEFLYSQCTPDEQGAVELNTLRQAFYEFLPKSRQWSHTRITRMFKAAGCEIHKTTRDGLRGKFLIGYRLGQEATKQSDSPSDLDDGDF